MPTRKSRLTKAEDREYRTHEQELEQMGILIGCAGDPRHEPDRLTFEQIDHALATMFELPSGKAAVVVLAKMTVLSKIVITHVEMTTQCDDVPLELNDPEESEYYPDLICGLPSYPPKVLNHLLTSGLSVSPRCCQMEGVIIATGWSSVPPTCHDNTVIKIELFLKDERGNELSFDFDARLDRCIKCKYERRQRELRKSSSLTKRVSIFNRGNGQPGDQKSVPPEETSTQVHAKDDMAQPEK